MFEVKLRAGWHNPKWYVATAAFTSPIVKVDAEAMQTWATIVLIDDVPYVATATLIADATPEMVQKALAEDALEMAVQYATVSPIE